MYATFRKVRDFTLKAIDEVHESNKNVERYVIRTLKKLQVQEGKMNDLYD